MSYLIQARIAQDNGLIERVGACAATLRVDGDPRVWATNAMLDLAAIPEWVSAYAEADAIIPVVEPGEWAGTVGYMDDVITDEMILAAVTTLASREDAAKPIV